MKTTDRKRLLRAALVTVLAATTVASPAASPSTAGAAWRFGPGVQYQLSSTVSIGAACTFMWLGDMPVDQGNDVSLRGRVSGSYDDAWFAITTINLIWKF